MTSADFDLDSFFDEEPKAERPATKKHFPSLPEENTPPAPLSGYSTPAAPAPITPPALPNSGTPPTVAPPTLPGATPTLGNSFPTIKTVKADPNPNNPLANPNSKPTPQSFTPTEIQTKQVKEQELTLDELLKHLIQNNSSDLHLLVGEPPLMRKHGDIGPIDGYQPLSREQITQMLFAIMTQEQQTKFTREHDLDLAYSIPNLSRFRVNVLQEQRQISSVIRVIPNEIKTLDQLGMPEGLAEFAMLPRGLVLVCGPTGSGKSTTLAAIIDAANKQRKDHILTIEDPIEFVHQNQNSIIRQREIGDDTPDFSKGLRQALRQDPDIILVGEMRDPETIKTAMTAAETGHLVFGTLHTQSAAETMSRIIDSFDDASKPQVRAQLAATIQGIVCQTLLKTIDGNGRIAAMEILKGEPGIRSLIRKAQEEQIRSALETGGKKGMQTLDMDLQRLVNADKISLDEAANKATDKDSFLQSLGGDAKVAQIRRRQQALGGQKISK